MKILFVVPGFFKDRPQTIRFRELLSELIKESKNDYHILTDEKRDNFKNNNYGNLSFHVYRTSLLGSFINPNYYTRKKPTSLNKFLPIIRTILVIISKVFLFPDLFKIEIRNIKRRIESLIIDYRFELIVLSCSPFSLMELSSNKVKWKTKIILDIGDPFTNNSTKYETKNKLIKKTLYENKYLKYIDSLVVTNGATKKLYLEKYGYLNANMIHIIPQGFRTNFLVNESHIKFNTTRKEIRIAYFGKFYKGLREPFLIYQAILKFNGNNSSKVYLDLYGNISAYHLKGVDNNYINYKGLVDYFEVYTKSLEYDALLLVDNFYGYQTPGKLFEVLSIPIQKLIVYKSKNTPLFEIISELDLDMVDYNIKDLYNILGRLFDGNLNRHSFESKNIEKYQWGSLAIDYHKVFNVFSKEQG